MFFRKSALETDEYQTLIKRLIDLEARILSLETSNSVFRDKVLRKVQKVTDETEELNTSEGGILRNGLTKQSSQGRGANKGQAT